MTGLVVVRAMTLCAVRLVRMCCRAARVLISWVAVQATTGCPGMPVMTSSTAERAPTRATWARPVLVTATSASTARNPTQLDSNTKEPAPQGGRLSFAPLHPSGEGGRVVADLEG